MYDERMNKYTKQIVHVPAIVAECLATLKRYEGLPDEPDFRTIHVDHATRTLTYAPVDDEPAITEEQAKEVLHQWVTESITKYGYMTMYACGDNAHIICELRKRHRSYDDKHDGLPLYVAWD